MVDYTYTTGILEGTNRVTKHLSILYTTESGSKITLFDDDVAEVTWSDGNGIVRVEGKTQAAANSGLNLLEMLTGAAKARESEAEPEPEPEPEVVEKKPAIKTVKKAAAKPVVVEQPVE